jgi:hypothetical protein
VGLRTRSYPGEIALRSDAYTLDKMRRRVLAGLTPEETREFELLDAQLPFDGKPVCPSAGLSLSPIEYRWLQLFEKMESAIRSVTAPEPSKCGTALGRSEVRPMHRNGVSGQRTEDRNGRKPWLKSLVLGAGLLCAHTLDVEASSLNRSRAWCGSYMAKYFGTADSRLALARMWASVGTNASGEGEWIVHSENDGGAARTRPRAVARNCI